MRDQTTPGAKFKRGGLHKLVCPGCPGYTYSTVANIEAVGLPRCACGETFQPERLELALMLGHDDAPVVEELARRTDDKERSQLRSVGRSGEMLRRFAGTLNDMSAKALEEIRCEQREEARARRLNALLPAPEPMPF
jgi:hypothetical protein